MSTVAKQLEQLNKEIAAEHLEVRAAFKVYNTARAATTHAQIALAGAPRNKMLQLLHDAAREDQHSALGRYEDLKKEDERLLGGREALQAKLPGAGERALLLRRQQHQALRDCCSLVRRLKQGSIRSCCWKGRRQAVAWCQCSALQT